MLLCFLLLAFMLWVGFYFAPLIGYNSLTFGTHLNIVLLFSL